MVPMLCYWQMIAKHSASYSHYTSTVHCSTVHCRVKPLLSKHLYPGTSLNWAADLPYFMLMLQKLWATVGVAYYSLCIYVVF